MGCADAYLDTRLRYEPRDAARFNFVRDVVEVQARERDGATALFWTDARGRQEVITFAELSSRAKLAAGFIQSLGLKRGDILILVLSREQAWWEIMLGCLQLGVVVSPGTTQLMKKDFAYRLEATQAAALVTNEACAARTDEAIVDIDWKGVRVVVGARDGWKSYAPAQSAPLADFADTGAADEALLYFTSGTTGNPKMTVHGAAYPLGHETTGRFWLRATPGDLVWNVSDTGWAKGAWTSLCAPWLCGAGLFAHHADAVDPARVLECLEKFPVSILCAPPTAYRMLVKLPALDGIKFSALRHCVSAGEPLNPEVIDVWRAKTGLEICEGYGQTETTILCGVFDGMKAKPGSMGLPAPGVDLAVIGEPGERLPPGVEGDVAVALDPAPKGFFLGYKNEPERTSATRRGRWYLTGDRAYTDEDGYFWFVGRGDDVIITAGYRIGPFEIESALIEHPAVAESAVVASPDETRGEVVKAFVVLARGFAGSEALVRELQDHVKGVTAPYKYPRKIEFVGSLPKTISGKIIRKDLRAREWEGRG
jgi:medium-chain acyl-CoA synthetase